MGLEYNEEPVFCCLQFRTKVCDLEYANIQKNDFVQNTVHFPKNSKNFI